MLTGLNPNAAGAIQGARVTDASGNPTGKSLSLLAEKGWINAVSVAVNGGKLGLLGGVPQTS
ncbi:hypothetical protein [Massilia sp. S19_KUP03_FR1]|uniref:hypothetical protein n=1 Tax=Massilia sp. S19_KUP03_FR1 TaxID=3025503 RepID=UPI002FCD05B9